MAKNNKEKQIVPRVEINEDNGHETHFFYLTDEDAKAEKVTRVTIDPERVNVPTPEKGKGQKRVKVADYADHPAQATVRNVTGNKPTADLLLQLVRPLTVNGSENHPACGQAHGQDETRDLPHFFKDGHKGRGHKRSAGVVRLFEIAPDLAQTCYPDGSLLVTLHDIPHDDFAALRIVNDHGQDDERERPLLIERLNAIEAYEAQGYEKAAIIQLIGSKQNYDDCKRLAALPDIRDKAQKHAESVGADYMATNKVARLLSLACKHFSEQAHEADKEEKAEEMKAQGKKPAEIKAELSNMDEAHAKKAGHSSHLAQFRDDVQNADPSEYGDDYADTLKAYTEGKKADKAKGMKGEDLKRLRRVIAGHRATDNQYKAFKPLLDALIAGDLEKASAAGKALADLLPVDTDASAAAVDATEAARAA